MGMGVVGGDNTLMARSPIPVEAVACVSVNFTTVALAACALGMLLPPCILCVVTLAACPSVALPPPPPFPHNSSPPPPNKTPKTKPTPHRSMAARVSARTRCWHTCMQQPARCASQMGRTKCTWARWPRWSSRQQPGGRRCSRRAWRQAAAVHGPGCSSVAAVRGRGGGGGWGGGWCCVSERCADAL